ncbi:hypothetical protein [Arthrobacter crystallopoietes]|uniref:Flagellar biosynthetic protein FliP n=1 Tax=Crystallibacter crystallopoietes TaxID=37928 RepID=A0A1H1DY75_9MICC|nr:hypothetical protein [Arthrobacter crystallopoietes]AUI50116.1 hypothetical protein AC20117_04065 [Arthrobacter crystallopoietes]SDQ81482.1 hypothetical protein SAMN04489742_2675 [Arthrobacter crystallopoietes]
MNNTELHASTSTTTTSPTTSRGRRIWLFTRHYLEMVVAMILGMVVLGPVWNWLTRAAGVSAVFDRPDVASLVMATNMTVAMGAWMKFRGHGWAPIIEMGAAMYLPFIVLFVPLWMGAIDGHTVMAAGHLLMLPAMAIAMLLRLDEYTQDHAHHRHSADQAHEHHAHKHA